MRGGVGEISIAIVEALPTTEPSSGIHLMAIHCAVAERGGLIRKLEIRSMERVSAPSKSTMNELFL